MELWRGERRPTIKSVMTPFPHSVDIDDPVTRAEEIMREYDVRHVPVEENGYLVGVATHRDTVRLVNPALDEQSRSDTYPYIEILEQDVSIGHEASVSRIGEEQMFYLTSRGLTEAEASTMIVNGFIEPLVKELPMEYAVEMNRLIQLQMEGSVG